MTIVIPMPQWFQNMMLLMQLMELHQQPIVIRYKGQLGMPTT